MRGFLLFVALICGASLPRSAAVAQDALTVDTAALGMTGWRWRTEPLPASVDTDALGMTGWRWRTEPLPGSVDTDALGMTGWRWRTEPLPTSVDTAALGMTGWRTGPEPPQRTQPFKVTAANLILFHNGQPLPNKLEGDCPVSLGHRALFTTEGKLPGNVKYHFEWNSGQRSTEYAKLDKGDRKDPLYEPPSAFHEFPYPLPSKDQGGPKGLAAKQGKSKGPAPEAAGPAGPANEHKGSVRVVATNPYGAVASGWAPYHIVCSRKLEVLSGTLELRDPAGPACPRRAEAALSLRTNVAGPVPYSLDCTGDRSWSETATARDTGPGTFLAVAVLPFSIKHREQVNCTLKSRQKSPPKIVALRGHAYDCVGPNTGLPSTTGQPPRVVDPPKPLCVGGKVVDRGTKVSRYTCQCPTRQTALSTGPNSYRCQAHTTASIACAGGSVRNGQCICPSNMQRMQTSTNSWRCTRPGAQPRARPRPR
jgi:hypothetical protein